MKTVINNKTINYTDNGKGNVLVLLHGFTESLQIWKSFSDELSKEYRVICIDLPGHGDSENISDVHTMDLIADVVKNILDILSVNKCVMIGHSMGGYVSLSFARQYSNFLAGLGLFHSTANADNENAIKARLRAIELIKGSHKEFLSAFIPDLFAPDNREKYKKEINDLIIKANKMSKDAIIAAQLGMKDRPASKDILSSAHYPVMFICGHEDSRVSLNDIQLQATLCKIAYCLFLKNTGHMGYIEEKQITLDFVRSFANAIYKQ